MQGRIRPRIAVLLGQPEEYTHTLFLRGLLEESFKSDFDVCVFGMYIKYQNTLERSIGDSSIFRLISYDKFDAVIVMADTIQTRGEAERIEEEIHEKYKGKVLFIDKESKYFPSIHIDNYTPARAVIDHLIEVHGMKEIAFLTGKEWHPHSKIRLQAYKDSLREHGVAVDEHNIYYGDFWYTSGESLAESLVSQGRLPEAVACANDCMALGLAKGLTSKGLKIPDDIAVVGCDSNTEGEHAPVPLTSAPLQYELLGKQAVLEIKALLEGTSPDKIEVPGKLFIGGTCGCNCPSVKPVYHTRTSWDTELSLGTIFSPFNHSDDDLISQTTFRGLVNTIFGCLHLVRGFDSFNLCLNPGLGSADVPFEDKIMHVIRAGVEGGNSDRIMMDEFFPREQMLPELYEERERPSVYYFMPLFFEDSVFGYAAVSFEDRVEVISSEYRAWLRSLARGIESFRRADAIIGSSKIARKGITTDSLTGLPNYKGFLENADTMLHLMNNNGCFMGALAVDIKDLSEINDNYGRKEGDRAIITVANVMDGLFSSRNCMCFRVGNDEFVALRITRDPDSDELLSEKDKLLDTVRHNVEVMRIPYGIDLYYGIESGSPKTSEELELLVNVAISRKNSYKAAAYRVFQETSLSEEEQHDALVVQNILDDNRIIYHFQPIVDARTAKVFAYEALMRADVTPYLAPPVVLRYADFCGRLYDVERATFMNVIKSMRDHQKILSDGRKIFINSIPGQMLREEDLKVIEDYVGDHPDSIVVEFTEHSEMDGETLTRTKKICGRLHIDTAVDDYGTGYSNVSNLLRYTPRYVKIDRALISGIEDSPQKKHFVREIIEFSHDNGITALAEGVETSEELKTVIRLGVDLIQGYYTGRPSAEMVQSIDSNVVDEIRKFALLQNAGEE